MGMFDDIKCEYPLPDQEAQDLSFQTKDLDCLMEQYTITTEGRLIKHHWDWEATPEDELPNRHEPEGSFLRLRGIIRKVEGSYRVVDLNYHGMLNFYSGDSDYLAKFTDGTLVSIERVKDQPQ